MLKLLKQVQEVERDIKEEEEEYGVFKPKYDSLLTDIMIINWTHLFDPWKWIISDETLKQTFQNSFLVNKKFVNYIELYRGTDHKGFLSLKEGDSVNYEDRYTSWTTDISVCAKFTNYKNPIYLVYKGPIETFDLKTRDEKEHIVAPSVLIVDKIITISGRDDENDSEVLYMGVRGLLPAGKGRIFILKSSI